MSDTPFFKPREELVSVMLIREDLRQLLLAAELYQGARADAGQPRVQRLDLAVQRIVGTAPGHEWQPKPNRQEARMENEERDPFIDQIRKMKEVADRIEVEPDRERFTMAVVQMDEGWVLFIDPATQALIEQECL